MDTPPAVAAWHEVASTGDPDRLDAILADEIVFRSPAVHTPQVGRELATTYLRAALQVLGPTLTYHREWYAADSAVLEFSCELDNLQVHGVDMIAWNHEDKLVDFCVMVRPHKGLEVLIEKMVAEMSRQ